VIGQRIVLIVLTSWLALPVLSLACAMSCLPPAHMAVSHCHESAMDDGAARDSGTAIRAGHQCTDHAPFAVTATTIIRYATSAPALPIIVTVAATDTDDRGLSGPSAPTSATSPPDRPIIPLRL
jgi:hypothetical protein